jgi:hypothetical protein
MLETSIYKLTVPWQQLRIIRSSFPRISLAFDLFPGCAGIAGPVLVPRSGISFKDRAAGLRIWEGRSSAG